MWYLQPRAILETDPSVQDGLESEQVARNRTEACQFISKIGRRLHL